jgi:hypothetical protein
MGGERRPSMVFDPSDAELLSSMIKISAAASSFKEEDSDAEDEENKPTGDAEDGGEEEEEEEPQIEINLDDDDRSLKDCGISCDLARPENPIKLALVYKVEGGGDDEFEEVDIEPVSKPSELPDDDDDYEPTPRPLRFGRVQQQRQLPMFHPINRVISRN